MNNFNFNRDFYEGCRALGDREGMALAWAMLRYGYEGVEPKLKPTTMAAFTFARGRIDAMVNGSLGGLRRAANAGGQGSSQGGSQGGSRQKEKEKEIALAGYSAARQAPDDFEPPSAEDVEAYFAANCLRGDARQFFDYYEANGWTRQGFPIAKWEPVARSWSDREKGYDAERKARGGQTSQEVERAAVWRPAETEDELIAELERQIAEAS